MTFKKIVSFVDDQQKEVGYINASITDGKAYFQIIGRIWSWSVDEESDLRGAIEDALKQGIKHAHLYLNTGGGSTIAAAEIVNLFKRFETTTCSVGALIASAGTYIIAHFPTTITSNTQGMIHKPRGFFEGNEDELQSDLKLLQNTTADYRRVYAAKFKKSDAEIDALWNKGDYWMNAQEMITLGLADKIEGEIKAYSKADIQALTHYGAPVIPKEKPIKIENNPNTMNRETLIAIYGLESNATDQQIEAAAKQAQKAKKTVEQNAQTVKDLQAEKVSTLIEAGFKAKKYDAKQKEHYTKLATADYDSTKAVIEALPAIPQLTDEINPSTPVPQAGQTIQAGREKWTLEDWIEKDPKGYKKMLAEGSEIIQQLEADYFA